MRGQPIYQFYAALDNYAPTIWRRFLVPSNITVAKLAYIVMTLFEMVYGKAFEFSVPIPESAERPATTVFYRVSDRGVLKRGETIDATKELLKHSHIGTQLPFLLRYDKKDSWRIRLQTEEIFSEPLFPMKELPRVTDGAGYGIVDGCGGIHGLHRVAKAYERKYGIKYQRYHDMTGREELETFDLADMNYRLKKVPRILFDRYEYNCEPLPYSRKILQRDYMR